MPTIEVSLKDLKKLSGLKFSTEKIKESLLMYLKADVEKIERDKMSIKLEDTNRPDLWCVEGLARALRKIFGKSVKKYSIKPSGITVHVDKNLKNIRPYVACAVVKNMKITEDILKSIIQYQEKLGENYGRKRAKVALGVYDFDKIKGKKIRYIGVKPDEKFTPLGFKEEMTLTEILKKHPKGIEYAKLLKGRKLYPVFIDESKQILSMPPITNSETTGKVTKRTKNLFVEATGTDFETVLHTLNIFVMSLAERGGKVFSVRLKYNYVGECGFERSPKFKSSIFQIKPSYINKTLGLGLTLPEMRKLLTKMDYKVTRADSINDLIVVEVPFYRKDIMHAVDIVEDIAIAYDYNNIEPLEPRIATKGGLLDETKKQDLIREIMIGMQFQEILSFTLTSKEILFDKMNTKGKSIEVINPISSNYSNLRNAILPLVIKFLEINKTVEFPQRVFEIGPIVLPDPKAYNNVNQENHLCAAVTHSKATFTEIKSALDTLMKQLDKEIKIKHTKHPSFIEGRCGEIIFNKKSIGIIGEIHPQVLENFNLENPVVVFEINVDAL